MNVNPTTMVMVDRDSLQRELLARGWDYTRLVREARVGTNTIAKINQGKPVLFSVKARIAATLSANPPLETAVEL